MSIISLTFGEQSENHKGMQLIGNGLANEGLTLQDLQFAKEKFEEAGHECDIHELSVPEDVDNNEDYENGYILIVRKGVNAFSIPTPSFADELLVEQSALDWDKKAFMYGRVVNKLARHNLCFGPEAQEPVYQEKKGRIIKYDSVPKLSQLRDKLQTYFGNKATNLQVEGNHYYDKNKCGIGFHGDSERKIVIAVRLGESGPLHYHWFQRGTQIGQRYQFQLNHGDLYAMSEKATGNDWKKKIIPTLRHAAGCQKFLKLPND